MLSAFYTIPCLRNYANYGVFINFVICLWRELRKTKESKNQILCLAKWLLLSTELSTSQIIESNLFGFHIHFAIHRITIIIYAIYIGYCKQYILYPKSFLVIRLDVKPSFYLSRIIIFMCEITYSEINYCNVCRCSICCKFFCKYTVHTVHVRKHDKFVERSTAFSVLIRRDLFNRDRAIKQVGPIFIEVEKGNWAEKTV